METIFNVINFLTPQQGAVIGGVIAAMLGTWGITALVKIRHFKKKGEKLWTGWVAFNVGFWGTALTFIEAAVASFDQVTGVLGVIPAAAPYALHYGPIASMYLLLVHTVISAVAKWWQARRDGKPLFAESLPEISNPNLQPAMETVSTTVSGMRSSSQGTESNGVIQL